MSHFFRRDAYDDLVYSWAREAVPALGGEAEKALGRERVEDIHASLIRRKVEQDPDGTPDALLDEMLSTQEYRALRARCRSDEGAAALATLELARGLAGKIPPRSPGQPGQGAGQPTQAERDAMRVAGREACVGAQRALDEAEAALAGLFGRQAGTHAGTPRATDRAALVKARDVVKRSRRGVIARILEMAGRMRAVCDRTRATRSRRGPGEITGVELGRDVARALPSELVALAPNAPLALRLDFMRRASEGQLAQFRQRAEVPHARGPIVVCVDESESMTGPKELWSKALALTMLGLAIEEGRAFALVKFASSHQARTLRWDARPSPDALVAALESFYAGGTDFATPLGLALDAVESVALRHADIIFLTDGEAPLSDEQVADSGARLAAKGTKVYTVLIGPTHGESVLEKLSRDVVRLPDLRNDLEALEGAFSVGL